MGASYVKYNGHGFWARDAHLEKWLLFLAEEIARQNEREAWAGELEQHFKRHATGGYNGFVNPKLDEFVPDDQRRLRVVGASTSTIQRLLALGMEIPPSVSNAWGVGGEGAYFTRPIETAVLERLGLRFVDLLNGILPPSASEVL